MQIVHLPEKLDFRTVKKCAHKRPRRGTHHAWCPTVGSAANNSQPNHATAGTSKHRDKFCCMYEVEGLHLPDVDIGYRKYYTSVAMSRAFSKQKRIQPSIC